MLELIDLMLHPGGEENRGIPGTYAAQLLLERLSRKYSNLNDDRRGIMIYVWKNENTLLYVYIYIIGL